MHHTRHCIVHPTAQHTAQHTAHCNPTVHCHAAQVVGLDSEAGGIGAFYIFPAVNVGLVYASAGGGAAQWVMEEVGRRARHYLRNAPIRRTAAGGVEQMVLWEQDLFRDGLEGAAFNSTRYRHSLRHGFESGPAARRWARAHAQPWEWQTATLPNLPPPSAAWPQGGRVPWLPLHLPLATHLAADADAADAADAAAAASVRDHAASHVTGQAKPRGSTERVAGLPQWAFSQYVVQPHGHAGTGEWALSPSPVLIGHAVGTRAKYFLLRALGWWAYAAELPPSTVATPVSERSQLPGSGGEVTVEDTSKVVGKLGAATGVPGHGWGAEAEAARRGPRRRGGQRRRRQRRQHKELRRRRGTEVAGEGEAGEGDVEGGSPEAGQVFSSDERAPLRVLVLRRHNLAWRPMQKGQTAADSDGVPLAMARWALLALALGRRAVLPFVPCEVPRNVPALPPQLWETIIPFSNVSWCDAAAREPRAALPPAAALGWSAAGADTAANTARSAHGERSACCLWVPPAACVDLVGRRAGGLRGELLLTEPDYGQLLGEAPRKLRDYRTARVANTTWVTAVGPVGRDLGPTGISLDSTERSTRVLVLDAAAASSDLRQLGTISNLEAAAVRQWAPCLHESTDKAARDLAALEQGTSAGEHMPHSETCSPEQRDLAQYATERARTPD